MTVFSRFFARAKAGAVRLSGLLRARFAHFFAPRPILRRVLLVSLLYGVIVCPLALFFVSAVAFFGGLWAVLWLGVFLGLGAERTSHTWDDFFALPPVAAFAVWRWYALERRRFIASALSLLVLWALTLLLGHLT